MEVTFKQQIFILDLARALYHPASQSLVIADVHLGKTTHFRKNGLAIPMNVAQSDLEKLSDLIKKYSPQKVIIAGDFFHASANSEIELFKTWRQQYSNIEFILIKGNHDRLKPHIYQELGLKLESNKLEINTFGITHKPLKNPERLTICGHIHPGVQLKLKAKQYVRLPSFVFQENQIILPAFSEFTGLDTSFQNSSKNFVITDTAILEI